MTSTKNNTVVDSERSRNQQKWKNFADTLRSSADTEVNSGVSSEKSSVHQMSRSPNQQGFDDERNKGSSGDNAEANDVAFDSSSMEFPVEDGFEIVSRRKLKPTKKADRLSTRETNHSVPTTEHSPSPALQGKPNNNAAVLMKNAAAVMAETNVDKCPSNAHPVKENGLQIEHPLDVEHDASNHSSDSAFAENQSPSHGSSTSLHYVAESESHDLSDSVVALSDEEKWPELSVTIRSGGSRAVPSPLSARLGNLKISSPRGGDHTTTEDEILSPTGQRRGSRPQWKKMDVDISYKDSGENKFDAAGRRTNPPPRRPFNGHPNEQRPPRRPFNTGYQKRRRSPGQKSTHSHTSSHAGNHENKANVVSNEVATSEEKKSAEEQKNGVAVPHSNGSEAKPVDDNANGRRNTGDYNYRRNFRNGYRDHNDEYPRRRYPNSGRNFRHSVPSLFNGQGTSVMWPVMYAVGPNVVVPNFPGGLPVSYATANGYLSYGTPVVQMPYTAPHHSGFASQRTQQSQTDESGNENPRTDGSLADESSCNETAPAENIDITRVLKRIFGDDRSKTTRDLTQNVAIVSQLSEEERKIVLRHQIQFYFSYENLNKDLYIRQNMDQYGFVSLRLLSTFPRVKILNFDMASLIDVLSNNEMLELFMDGEEAKVRTRFFPLQWPAQNAATGAIFSLPANHLPTPAAQMPAPDES